jgi:CBS domain-containing protein
MTTDVIDRVAPIEDRPDSEAAAADRGARRLPTAAEVMSRDPRTVDAQASLFSAWGQLHGEHNQHLVVIDESVRPIGCSMSATSLWSGHRGHCGLITCRFTSCSASGRGHGCEPRTTWR